MTIQQLPAESPAQREERTEGEDNVLLSTLLSFAQTHQERFAEQAAGLGLTVPQARVLYHVDAAPTVRKLAGKLRCDASYVTGLVDRLEAREVMKRQVDPEDRRVKVLSLTTSGRRLRDQVVRAMDEAPGLDTLSTEEKRQLGALLRKASSLVG